MRKPLAESGFWEYQSLSAPLTRQPDVAYLVKATLGVHAPMKIYQGYSVVERTAAMRDCALAGQARPGHRAGDAVW
jgi:hypothetical protein